MKFTITSEKGSTIEFDTDTMEAVTIGFGEETYEISIIPIE